MPKRHQSSLCYCLFFRYLLDIALVLFSKKSPVGNIIALTVLMSSIFFFLSLGDILVYINDTCVLGTSHKKVLEMLKVVPVGQSVDMVVRRGYPLLYDPDGSPRLSRETASQPSPLPTTTQPKAQARLPQSPAFLDNSGLMYNAEERYLRAYGRSSSRFSLDANGNASHYSPPPRMPSSYRYSSEGESDILRPQHSQRRIRQLQRADLASQSDSEVVSAIGSHR